MVRRGLGPGLCTPGDGAAAGDSTAGTAASAARVAAHRALSGVTLESVAVALLAHLHVDDDHGDVVGAAVPVGRVDQALGRLGRVVDLTQNVGHLVAADLVREAVRAEEQAVAGAQLELPHVGVHLRRTRRGRG